MKPSISLSAARGVAISPPGSRPALRRDILCFKQTPRARQSYDNVATRRMIAQGSSVVPHLMYSVFLWDDMTQSVAKHAIMSDQPCAVRFAEECLRGANVPEPGYEDYLLEQMSRWDGTGSHTVTTERGKIVLMATQPIANVDGAFQMSAALQSLS